VPNRLFIREVWCGDICSTVFEETPKQMKARKVREVLRVDDKKISDVLMCWCKIRINFIFCVLPGFPKITRILYDKIGVGVAVHYTHTYTHIHTTYTHIHAYIHTHTWVQFDWEFEKCAIRLSFLSLWKSEFQETFWKMSCPHLFAFSTPHIHMRAHILLTPRTSSLELRVHIVCFLRYFLLNNNVNT